MLFKQIKTIMLFSLIFYSAFSTAQNKEFVGSYNHSEMELAEQIHILASHRFSWQQVYGARNTDFRGKWTTKGDTIVLTLDPMSDNKNLDQLEAVLSSSGDLSVTKLNNKSYSKPKIFKRSEYSLSQEVAEELAQPIDYSKVIAEKNSQLEKQKEKAQKRFKKLNEERKKFGKYHGFFKNDETDSPVILALSAKRNRFLFSPATENGPAQYFKGTFTVKNDTAYATTTADQDEIKLYGAHSGGIEGKQLVIYFRKLDSKNIRVKSGKRFDESTFISFEKFKKENDSIRSLQLKKGDSLWIAIGKKEAHSYSFSLKDQNYNQLLVQPNYGQVETWVEKPIYVTDEDKIHSLYEGKVTLKLTLPERLYPPLSPMPSYPRFQETRYFPIDRQQLFKLQKE